MARLADTHFHIESMKNSRWRILPESYMNSIETGMDIAVEPNDIERRIGILKQYPNIKFSVGAGPWCAEDFKKNSSLAKAVITNVLLYSPAAVGEIGLDYYHREYASKNIQQELFEMQIDLANEFNLPVSIHDREAHCDVLETLTRKRVNRTGVIHCFSGNPELAVKFVDLGYLIAFGGAITYRGNDVLRSACRTVPDDSIVFETDSPYLAPVPFRGMGNSPANMNLIYSAAAKERGCDFDLLCDFAIRNFRRVFS